MQDWCEWFEEDLFHFGPAAIPHLQHEFFSRQQYLHDMNHGFRPQKPPQPYDIRDDYYHRFESHQERVRREERE